MKLRTFFTTVFPSMIAGGVLFGSAFGHADAGRTIVGFWPAAGDVGATTIAQRGGGSTRLPPAPPAPPASPASPAAPMPPMPPMPPMGHGHHGSDGVNVSIHDGKIQIDGVKDLVDGQLDTALQAVRNAKGMPPEVRAKLEKRIERLRAKLAKRLSHLDAGDMDQLGEELGQMGDEIGQEMDQFGQDMDKWGQEYGKAMNKWGKDFGKQFGKDFAKKFQHGPFMVHAQHDDDDDNDIPEPPDVDDDTDVDGTVASVGDLSLTPAQRAQIQAIRASSDRQVEQAQRELDRASQDLKGLLARPDASENQVNSAIDAVTRQEALIRKVRIHAWMQSRSLLEAGQRQKVESAVKGRTK